MTELRKRCLNCNKMFGRHKTPSGRLEFPSAFKKKRFCNRICGGVWIEAQKHLARDQGSQQEKANG